MEQPVPVNNQIAAEDLQPLMFLASKLGISADTIRSAIVNQEFTSEFTALFERLALNKLKVDNAWKYDCVCSIVCNKYRSIAEVEEEYCYGQCGSWARELLTNMVYLNTESDKTQYIFIEKIEDLGFTEPVSYNDLVERIRSEGFELCPETTALHLLKYKVKLPDGLTVVLSGAIPDISPLGMPNQNCLFTVGPNGPLGALYCEKQSRFNPSYFVAFAAK